MALAQILGTGQLNVERRSHTATLLQDGKVLIVGGDNQNGIVSQAEIFDPVSRTSALAAALITPRTDHSATTLSDGRVLVIGGRDQTASLQSTEIYNPLTTSFVAGPAMIHARSGHSATILANDKILVTGGDLFGSAEIYDPVTQSFSLVTRSLNTPRKFHSAILLQSGQIMIVGGVNAQDAMLNSAEVFDPASQTFYLPPTEMQTARAFATLKLLTDGKVQIIGGDAEFSMEVFDPTDGIFIAKALLPPNADLLGATLSTQSRAALFSPAISQDPLLQGVLTAEQLSLLDRADQSITELPSHNQALVAGGVNSAGQVLKSAKLVSSSTASVTTDKTDYAPGQIVTITGSGFQPNEQVAIYFHEFPEEYPDVFLSATANQQGNFLTAEFAPKQIDLGRIFTLTGIGQTSGLTAQTAFKDANAKLTVTVTGNGSVSSSPAGVDLCRSGSPTSPCQENYTITTPALNVTLTPTPDSGSVFVGWGGDCSGAGSCIVAMGTDKSVTATFTATVATTLTLSAASPATIPFGSIAPVALSATLTRTSGGAVVSGATITFKVDAVSVGTALTNASGIATISSYNPSALSVGTHAVQASFAQQIISSTTYTASTSGNQPVIISKVDPTCTVNGFTGPYDGIAHGAMGSCKGIDGTTILAGLNLGASFTNVPGGTANWSFTDVTGNYNNKSGSVDIVINKADATINVVGYTGVYDGLPHGASGTAAGMGGADLSASLSLGSTFTNVPGGTANWTFTDATGNYNNKSGSVEIVINKADATINVVGYSGVYDGNAHGASGTAKGVGGVDLSSSLNFGSTFTNVPGGTANWTFTDVSGNYNNKSGSVDIVINKADATINVVGYTGVYDGNAHGASGTATGVGGLDLSSSLNFGSTFTNVPGGTANWTFTDVTGNYNDKSGSVDIVINKRLITLIAEAKNKTYGDPDPMLTFIVSGSGLASGDSIASVFSGALTRAPGQSVAGSPYVIVQGTLAVNSNYTVTSFTPSALTILPKQLVGSVTVYNKQYDGNNLATIATRALTGVLTGDDVSYLGGSAIFDSKLAGTNKLVTVTGLYLSGAQAGNYIVNSTATTYASIAPLGFAGFLSPIGGADSTGGSYVDTIRTIKLGSTLPVKFTTFTDGGSPWLTGIHTIQAIKFSNATTSEAALELTATDTATMGNQFRLTDGQWHFNLSTKTQSGFSKGIWQIVATLEDGTRHFAWIELKP
jgi:YDG domain/Divergent InlB B-repeat domain/Galactose oxidase, central domain